MPKASRKTATPLTRAEASARVLAMRKASGMNQSEFWALFGVSQSGGSRYETGRAIPLAVRMLLQDYREIDAKTGPTISELSRDLLTKQAAAASTTDFLKPARAAH